MVSKANNSTMMKILPDEHGKIYKQQKKWNDPLEGIGEDENERRNRRFKNLE